VRSPVPLRIEDTHLIVTGLHDPDCSAVLDDGSPGRGGGAVCWLDVRAADNCEIVRLATQSRVDVHAESFTLHNELDGGGATSDLRYRKEFAGQRRPAGRGYCKWFRAWRRYGIARLTRKRRARNNCDCGAQKQSLMQSMPPSIRKTRRICRTVF
jgi:hypothetical protein